MKLPFAHAATSEVRVTVHVDPSDGRQRLFRVVLRFSNPSSASVTGSVEAASSSGATGSLQSKEVVFPARPSPSFLTVPGEGFAEPFALAPGKWILRIRAEGVLLDYLVLLPQDYYEAPLLQDKTTEPCTYSPYANRGDRCKLYKHVSMDGFSSAQGSQGTVSSRSGRRRRQARVLRPTPDHPEMVAVSGRQLLQLSLRVPRPGPYSLVLEYASEVDTVQSVTVLLAEQSDSEVAARVNIYSCAYSFLCRSVALESGNQVAVFQLPHRTDVRLLSSTASFLLYKVYAIPEEEFSMEYVEPKVLCVSTHGRFTQDSRHCVLRQFDKPPSAKILYAGRDGRLSSAPAASPQQRQSEDWRQRRQTKAFPEREPQSDGVLLKFPQTEITFTAQEPLRGRYVVVVHYRQPEHTSFPVDVLVTTEKSWKGSVNTSFCPAVSGCRQVVNTDGQPMTLDFDENSWQIPTISVMVPPKKTLTLDYIMLVPDRSYSPNLLEEQPLDKSADFIQQCRGEGFHIDHSTSTQYCRDSARSLVAAYNDGALPCNCDTSGSTGDACEPMGGQCPCREHIIGRQCTKCSTGYYGFPYCRPCECGRRLCDEVTGSCICPPQTVRPACDVCEAQTFSYHPLLGCEDCDCLPSGIKDSTRPECDRITGQCSCKPRIGGRQCDRCAPGHYRFPDCVPCDCNQGGVAPGVCHPDTGKCLCKSVDMNGWRLESPDQEDVVSVLNTASNTVVADIQELSPTVQTLHWVAPPSYLGNRVSSYGGFLTYQSKSFGIPSEGMILVDRRPDVVLTGDGMTLVHVASQVPLADRLYEGRVHLVEGNWRHAITNGPVSREELMRVLSDLIGLRIRALYFTQSQRLSLGEVGLEEATNTGTGGPAYTVERCSCPPQYTGDSCERCAPGYYRDASGPYTGQCVPCQCNGLADECDERTGRCQNCQYNTAGDRCERCKDGYYGNAAQRTCEICPCPFSVETKSFALGCREVYGDIQCVCKTGYTGERCESCAPGYFGDPLAWGGSCRPCNCNGNGNNCDPRTGVCKSTLEPGDTNTDERCQECDNCAQTLLKDLENLDEELRRIKSQLGNATASASAQERLKELEKALLDTKALVNKYNAAINNQQSKVARLEQEQRNLADDISSLKDKADKRAADADKAVTAVEKTHKRAKALDADIKSTLKKIQALLDQLQEAGTSGDSVPTENLGKLLDEATRMVKEMENRDFTPHKTAAEKERDEAKKLLEHIKANVSKQSDENEAVAKKLQDLLKSYQDKLKDLDEALKEANDSVKKANVQNGLNAQAMEDLKNRIRDLKQERKTVEDQMAMAGDELQKAKDLGKMLTDSKTEYEKLAAKLDGAKTDLTKKVNEISKAAAKEAVVEAAEDHARNLTRMADDLENAVKNASGRSEVRNAKDAIDAYKNITDAINAAENAANEAKRAADKALNDLVKQNLTDRVLDMKDQSEELLQEAKDANRELNDSANYLINLKKRLEEAEKKKTALQKDLQNAQKQLNGIKTDDISRMIGDAKRKAADANSTAGNTMNRLNDIQKEIDQIKVTPANSNLSNVLNDVDKTVKNLLNTIPSLNDKISEVENLTSQFSPLSYITENIKKIKELIEQARDAANKIAIPMKFTGNGHVELRPPEDLEDLKAYTSLALSLQRPEGRGDGRRRRRQTRLSGDMFVLYLGNKDPSKDYIGMAVRNNVLHSVYKLNGVVYEIKTGSITTSSSEPAKFDKVNLDRIYQDAKMVQVKDSTSNTQREPIVGSSQGVQQKNLLDLTPTDVVFYVGGYPSNFTPPAPLNYPAYKGCIEFSSVNDKVVSLYNFQNAERINEETPCKRYVNPKYSEYYEGTGFSKVLIDKKLNTLVIRMNLNTRSENGLLLYIAAEDDYFTVTMEKGNIYLHGNLLAAPASKNIKKFPTDDWLEILVICTQQKISVRESGIEIAAAEVKYKISEFKEFYVGGVPQELRERHNVTMQPYKGCLKNLKVGADFKTAAEQVGVSKGCPKEALVTRRAEFSPGSSLSTDLTDFSLSDQVDISLGFKSSQSQGLILQDRQQANGINIGLENGHVVCSSNTDVQKSNKQYNDDMWHYVTMTKTSSGGVQMIVDDEDIGQPQSSSTSIPDTGGTLFLGKDRFKGCISNLYTRRTSNLFKAEDLSYFQTSGDVLLDVCAANSPAQLMLDRSTRKEGVMQPRNELPPACAAPALVQHAYRMYGHASSLSYGLPLQVLQPRPHFSLDVRTRASEGLLFFAATRGGRAHLALYISKGRIRLSVGREKEIFNREKYNDGKWHSIIFSLEKKKFRLVVDGIRAQDGQLTQSELTSMQLFLSPVYLGAAPETFHKELKSKGLPKQSISGCVRNFKMNGAPMLNPITNHGAGPCFEGETQRGVYFSGNGAHVIANDSLLVNDSLELLFNIRPHSPTGLLLYFGSFSRSQNEPEKSHYLTVYMLDGEVVAQANNGKGKYMTKVKPKASLCDGTFHKISVIQRKNVVQLNVDTVDNYKVGPPVSTNNSPKGSLYVGGIPETTTQIALPVTSTFIGCIQDLTVNNEPVSFHKLPGVFGAINVRECPG